MSIIETRTIGPATIILGDCRTYLEELEGKDRAIVADPPYGISRDKGHAKKKGKNGWAYYGESDWDGARPEKEVFDLMLEKSKRTIIWGANYFADLLPPSQRWLVWDKGQRDFSLADVELAWTNEDKASRAFTYARGKALLDGKVFPTQKPIALMEWCLGFVDPDLEILDPFLGSGSTGVAAVRLGRRFVGVEVRPEAFELSCRRISEALAQPTLFDMKEPTFEPALADLFEGECN